MDVDRHWYVPYWTSTETLLAALVKPSPPNGRARRRHGRLCAGDEALACRATHPASCLDTMHACAGGCRKSSCRRRLPRSAAGSRPLHVHAFLPAPATSRTRPTARLTAAARPVAASAVAEPCDARGWRHARCRQSIPTRRQQHRDLKMEAGSPTRGAGSPHNRRRQSPTMIGSASHIQGRRWPWTTVVDGAGCADGRTRARGRIAGHSAALLQVRWRACQS